MPLPLLIPGLTLHHGRSTASSPPRPLTAAEVEAHPEFPYVTWRLEPAQKGKVAVAANRGGPLDIAYEVHGHGPIHIVWIMGLGGFKTAWQRQTKDFSHTQADKYSSLIIDNRGVGESDKPMMRYSSSEMARDVLEVLDHIGWTEKRQLHVVGISMGGMIAQEVAFLVPERVATLCLVSTASGLFNTVGFVENIRNRINLFIPRSIDNQLAHVKHNLFTTKWLESPDDHEYTKQPFPTNCDRFAAGEISKRKDPAHFNRTGFMAQAIAAGWHYKSPEQLREIADKVGRERIMVVHGTEDRMITFPHAKVLIEGLEGIGEQQKGEVEKRLIDGQGHCIPIEMRAEFKTWLEGLIAKSNA
ncbi:putative aminoacrylate hydrolase RutD [Diplodia seriata]|uniref:Putative aminoacrylate hydrolase RutD n=1 Tax=Diplodia seriata TaxID=420778 RepID=A0A1S8BHW9_9PEZI|nr:putative aminoacrylate hydrolase RutD [Diplodia seriata]